MQSQTEFTLLDLATNPYGICELRYIPIGSDCVRAVLIHSISGREIDSAHGNNKTDTLMRLAFSLGASYAEQHMRR